MTQTLTQDKLILASSSPRRRDLLREAGVDFHVIPPAVDEPADLSCALKPTHVAEALAYFKARAVSDAWPRNRVLGADTIVAMDDEIMGNPADADDARRMLGKLSRNRHEVITGVAIILAGRLRLIASDTTHVTMRPMSEQEIEQYIDSGEWEGKAGAYAIQETADRFVVKLEGSFSNVVGLPVELVERMLRQVHSTLAPENGDET
jgi:septum formation protein